MAKTHALQKIGIARIASDWVESGIHPDRRHSIRTVALGPCKPGERLFLVSQQAVSRGGGRTGTLSRSRPPFKEKNPDTDKDIDRIYATVEAKTLDGRTGTHLESYSLQDDPALRITPVKAILSAHSIGGWRPQP